MESGFPDSLLGGVLGIKFKSVKENKVFSFCNLKMRLQIHI